MPLPRIFRLSSFRLTLAYAGLFCLSFLILFAAIYWYAARLIEAQIDKTVTSEVAEIQASAGNRGLVGLADAVQLMTDRAPGFYYLLQDRHGAALAGNLQPMSPIPGVHEIPGIVSSKQGNSFGVRGRGVPVDDAYLFVGLSTVELYELHELVFGFLAGLFATILLALAGGSLISLRMLRRIEHVARTSREIVQGDLKRRLPVNGNDDEFDRLATSLNAMLERIQDLMEDIRQVSNDIAHDLRTPITRLRQRIEHTLRSAVTVEAMREAMEATLADVDDILATFGALLRIAQIESGSRKSAFASVDLSQMLQRIAEAYEPVAAEREQSLAAEIAPDLAVRGDRELLTQLFANLVENAIRHSPPGARIGLSVRPEGERIEARIVDNGPGIPAQFRQKVFQRFFRLEESRTSQGNGLGLSLVAAVAALHEIALDLDDNRPGLVVRILFPRANSGPFGPEFLPRPSGETFGFAGRRAASATEIEPLSG